VGLRGGLDVLKKRKLDCPCRDPNPGLLILYPSLCASAQTRLSGNKLSSNDWTALETELATAIRKGLLYRVDN
jgi:hypothetical protein